MNHRNDTNEDDGREERLINRCNTTRSNSDRASDLHHALRASRRRAVIRLLGQEEESELSTRLLARKIAAEEMGVEIEEASGEPYRNVYNALSQSHLPALDHADIVIYHSQRQTVSTASEFVLAYLMELTTTGALEALTGLSSNSDRSTGD